jgi:hypothetical protein
MLELAIAIGEEYFDDEKEEFVYPNVVILQLEHSLVSISKWESKWHKPFLTKDAKSEEETLDYVKCMVLNEHIPDEVYAFFTKDHVNQINNYIQDSMTATTFSNESGAKGKKEIITSELIYYWMVVLNIPSEYQYWHLNRLLTLIKVCNVKNTPPKKRSQREIMNQYEALNRARREKLNSKG